MSDDGEWFECECGQFAHMGMLCCHALKVMDYVGVKEIIMEASSLAESRDGLGFEDRQAAESNCNNIGSAGAIINVEGEMFDNENSVTLSGNWDALAGLSAPSKKHGAGRPCSSREKAPYEGLTKRTRFCSICKLPGHKKTTCPVMCQSSLASLQPARIVAL